MNTIAGKLKLDKDVPFLLINAPVGIFHLFDGFDIKKSITAKTTIAQVLLFVWSVKELNELVQRIRPAISPDTLFWVAYPKKSGSIKSDISRDHGWESVGAMGYEGVMAISIDDDWSALRFKPSAKSKYIPPADRKIEGIDFIARTVTLPADAKTVMKKHKDLDTFFDNMSFSHKKEYVEAIVEAKKPETRQKRIEKMVGALLKMKEQKEKKK